MGVAMAPLMPLHRSCLGSILVLSALSFSAVACGPDGPPPPLSGSGTGGSGGDASLPEPELVGEVSQITASPVDPVGVGIASDGEQWAVHWVDRNGGYPESSITLLSKDAQAVGLSPLGLGGGRSIRAGGQAGTFGTITGTSAQPTYQTALTFHYLNGEGAKSEGLTDYAYDPKSADIAPIGADWIIAICNGTDFPARLASARYGLDVPQSPFAPISIDPVNDAAMIACDEVKLVSTGDAVWAAFSGTPDGESDTAVFLVRLDQPTVPVRVSAPGVSASNPRVLFHGETLIVEHALDDSGGRALALFDLFGSPVAEPVELPGDWSYADDIDAAMVEDRVVLGWLGMGAFVQSFHKDGTPATAPFHFGPTPYTGEYDIGVAAIGDVVGVTYIGWHDDTGIRVELGRVKGL